MQLLLTANHNKRPESSSLQSARLRNDIKYIYKKKIFEKINNGVSKNPDIKIESKAIRGF